MEEKNMRELSLEEMDKVSGGAGSELYDGMKFYEMPAEAQWCAEDGYCPKCNPQMQGGPWNRFNQNKFGFYCIKCGFEVAIV